MLSNFQHGVFQCLGCMMHKNADRESWTSCRFNKCKQQSFAKFKSRSISADLSGLAW